MAIKILINGYYRSGTTMLFHQVNNALPVDSVGFYEPCYPLLGLVVRNEDSTKIQNLHGSTLWKSYQNLAEDVFEDLLRNHPNPDKKGIQNDQALIEYLNIYHNMSSDSFLQTNRYHLFLSVIKREFNPITIHVIRHPLNVFDSIKKAYSGNATGIKGLIKKLRMLVNVGDFFGNKSEFAYLIQRTGKPTSLYQNWNLKYFFKPTFFERIIVNWTISNYAALKAIEKNGDKLVIYEELVSKPSEIFAELSETLGLNVSAPSQIKNTKEEISKEASIKLQHTLRKFNLESEFEYIKSKVAQRGIQY
jgi:hypothetical protein